MCYMCNDNNYPLAYSVLMICNLPFSRLSTIFFCYFYHHNHICVNKLLEIMNELMQMASYMYQGFEC